MTHMPDDGPSAEDLDARERYERDWQEESGASRKCGGILRKEVKVI